MKKNCRVKKMNAWREWHGDMDEEDVPMMNLSFELGFLAAHDLLMPLLEIAAPHVFASAEAEHMLDGFKRRQPRKFDAAVQRRQACPALALLVA